MEDEKGSSKVENKPSILDKEKATNEELKKIIEERKGLLEQARMLREQEMMGGKSTAGIVPEPAKEETPAEYAKRIMSGNIGKR